MKYIELAILFCFYLFFIFFRATPAAYGGSWLGVKSELQLLAYATATATATSDPSRVRSEEPIV